MAASEMAITTDPERSGLKNHPEKRREKGRKNEEEDEAKGERKAGVPHFGNATVTPR